MLTMQMHFLMSHPFAPCLLRVILAICVIDVGSFETLGQEDRPFVAGNVTPTEFTALFNGKDVAGWKGLVADPPKRARLTPEELAQAQAKADEKMRAHWSVDEGVLVFDGAGDSLCTAKDYRNFEMLVDWKIEPNGDSGIYLRGSPQVQIWDPDSKPAAGIGSGGLYNNRRGPHDPLVKADRPIGQWNTFRIRMTDDKVSVWLNDQLVVDNVTLEY